MLSLLLQNHRKKYIIIIYRGYKNISNDLLQDNLNSLQSEENMNFDFTSLTSFTKIYVETLNKHAPIKKKYAPANHVNVFTKDFDKSLFYKTFLRKVIMLTFTKAIRSRLQNVFWKEKSFESKKAYSKQRNICVKSLYPKYHFVFLINWKTKFKI